MKVHLVYPPFVPDSRAFPPLSLPALTAYLKREGHAVVQRDLNIELFHYQLQPDVLAEIEHRLTAAHARELTKQVTRLCQLRRLCALDDSINAWLPYVRKEISSSKDMKLMDSRVCELVIEKLKEMLYLDIAPTKDVLEMSSPELLQLLQSADASVLGHYIARAGQELLAHNPDVIGMSLMTEDQLFPALMLADTIRKSRPDVFIVFGGGFVSAVADKIGRYEPSIFPLVDAFVSFDGEIAFAELLNRRRTGASLSGIANVVWLNRDAGRVEHEAPKESGSLDDLPQPDFNGLDLTRYTRPVIPYYVTKGCVYGRCAYCSDPSYSSPRNRSAARAAAELERLVDLHHPERVIFVDSYIHPEKLEALAKEIISHNIKIHWVIQTRMDRFLTTERIRLFAEAGCDEIWFGMETVNERMIRLIRKGTKREIITRILEDCQTNNIRVTLNCMIGFPTETEQEAADTIEFIESLGRSYPNLPFKCNTGFVFVPRLAAFGQTPQKFGIEVIDEFEWSPRLEWLPPEWRYRSRFARLEGRIFQDTYQAGDEMQASQRLAPDVVVRPNRNTFAHEIKYDILKLWRKLYEYEELLRSRTRETRLGKDRLTTSVDTQLAQDQELASFPTHDGAVIYSIGKDRGRRIVPVNRIYLLILQLIGEGCSVASLRDKLRETYHDALVATIENACQFAVRFLINAQILETVESDSASEHFRTKTQYCERNNFGQLSADSSALVSVPTRVESGRFPMPPAQSPTSELLPIVNPEAS